VRQRVPQISKARRIARLQLVWGNSRRGGGNGIGIDCCSLYCCFPAPAVRLRDDLEPSMRGAVDRGGDQRTRNDFFRSFHPHSPPLLRITSQDAFRAVRGRSPHVRRFAQKGRRRPPTIWQKRIFCKCHQPAIILPAGQMWIRILPSVHTVAPPSLRRSEDWSRDEPETDSVRDGNRAPETFLAPYTCPMYIVRARAKACHRTRALKMKRRRLCASYARLRRSAAGGSRDDSWNRHDFQLEVGPATAQVRPSKRSTAISQRAVIFSPDCRPTITKGLRRRRHMSS